MTQKNGPDLISILMDHLRVPEHLISLESLQYRSHPMENESTLEQLMGNFLSVHPAELS